MSWRLVAARGASLDQRRPDPGAEASGPGGGSEPTCKGRQSELEQLLAVNSFSGSGGPVSGAGGLSICLKGPCRARV